MSVNPAGPDPVYLQIADTIERQIESGELSEGGKLPSTRELTRQFEVALNTAVEAIKELRQRELIFTTNRGSFVAAGAQSRAGKQVAVSGDIAGQIKSLRVAVDEGMRALDQRLTTLEELVARLPGEQ